MKRNNIWNRIFHSKELKAQKDEYEKQRRIHGWYKQICEDLKEAESLMDLLNIHKFAWSVGYQNVNIAPCEWGMFRTKDIDNMTADEVFLGGLDTGLNTNNISFWETHKTDKWASNGYGHNCDDLLYDTIMRQYRRHLKSNIDFINEQAFKYILKYENTVC